MLLKKHLHLIIGLLITSLIFITNYKPDSYLIGWDNLQTDLDPALGIKRAFFGVWQEYQSFGLLGGLSHSADLLRAIFILFVSYILPDNLIRYSFHHLMILIGFLGAVKFCLDFSEKNKESYVALLGGIFYIFNYGTIQVLGLPWEAFSIFYAFFPWQIWIFLKILTQSPITKKNIFLLFIINLLATPQAYIQTLFISYFLILLALWSGVFLKNFNWGFLKKTFIIFAVILNANLFWILPQIYFLKTSAFIVREAKANILSTDDLKFINKSKGDLLSFIKLEGFYNEFRNSNQVFIFDAWRKYFEVFPIILFRYLLFTISLLGIFFIPKFRPSFLLAWILIAFVFLSSTLPFSLLHGLIGQDGFISQVFRSPFSKFIIPDVFFLSYFFSIGVYKGFELISQKRIFRLGFLVLILLFIFITYSPALAGHFFPPQIKVKLPQEYFYLFDFFKNQDKNKRITLLPDDTYWGWFSHNWGYNGSGFIWYGIEQPIVSRNFDVWNDKSEGYYWEVRNSLDAEDPKSFKKILDKYAIDYLIYDKSLLPVSSSISTIQYNRLDSILENTEGVYLVKKWNYLSIYKIDHSKPIQNFIWASKHLPNIGPSVKFTNFDNAFQIYGDYQTDGNKPFNVFYPFLDFFTQTKTFSHNWTLSEADSKWYLNRQLPFNKNDLEMIVNKEVKQVSIYKDNPFEISYPLSIILQNNLLSVQFPQILTSHFDILNTTFRSCGYAYETATCLSLTDSNLTQQYGYIIKVKNRNNTGQRLFFYVLDLTKNQPYLEDRLINDVEYYILPPKYQYGLGYEFNFKNNSYRKIPAVNSLEELSVFLTPYDQLKQLVFINKIESPKVAVKEPIETKKYNYFLYQALVASNDSYLILNQTYQDGWKAYQLKNWIPVELKEHIRINNWANGWKVDSSGTVIIIFWPQLLQFLGFGILILTIYIIYAATSGVAS